MKVSATYPRANLLETPLVLIQYIPSLNTMLIRWKQKPDDRSFQEAYWVALRYVGEIRLVTLFCTDLTTCGALGRGQEAWLNLEYYPEVHKTVKEDIYAAVVFSEDHFKAIVSNYLVSSDLQQQSFIHFNYFTQQEEALYWLGQLNRGRDLAVYTALS
ncbi:hypothetical protein [Pontibacter ummariensis]|uniref:hypothetical protein n=1 Tax=Pontibacter ummariensis TaxID=1610492 RepID=UPI000B76FF76|nr:hypothetical protein [Pontibacter ummariensis]